MGISTRSLAAGGCGGGKPRRLLCRPLLPVPDARAATSVHATTLSHLCTCMRSGRSQDTATRDCLSPVQLGCDLPCHHPRPSVFCPIQILPFWHPAGSLHLLCRLHLLHHASRLPRLEHELPHLRGRPGDPPLRPALPPRRIALVCRRSAPGQCLLRGLCLLPGQLSPRVKVPHGLLRADELVCGLPRARRLLRQHELRAHSFGRPRRGPRARSPSLRWCQPRPLMLLSLILTDRPISRKSGGFFIWIGSY
jgi:hypothetical protein